MNDNYEIALSAALDWICLNFKPIGIIVSAATESFVDRYEFAKSLVANTTGEYGFFEWDSGRD